MSDACHGCDAIHGFRSRGRGLLLVFPPMRFLRFLLLAIVLLHAVPAMPACCDESARADECCAPDGDCPTMPDGECALAAPVSSAVAAVPASIEAPAVVLTFEAPDLLVQALRPEWPPRAAPT